MSNNILKELDKYKLNKNEYKKEGTVFFNDLTVIGYSDMEGVHVDEGMKDLVRELNYENDITTIETCSGKFSDHYNVDKLNEELPYNKLKKNFDLCSDEWLIPGQAFLAMEPIMHHEINEDVVEVDREYYDNFKNNLRTNFEKDGDFYLEWRLNPDIPYSYDFILDSMNSIRLINYSNSYVEFDELLQVAINDLKNTITKTL